MIYKQYTKLNRLAKIKPMLKSQHGFSLIEVLIAAIILAVGLIGVGLFQSTLVKHSTLVKQRVEALNLAKEHLENLQFLTTSSQHTLSSLSGIIKQKEKTTEYSLQWSIIPNNEQMISQLNIQVTWSDFSKNGKISKNTTLHLASIIANKSPYAISQTSWSPVFNDTLPLPVLNFE